MMQHVATSKSEVAAFATGTESSSKVDSAANTQFGKILQDHETSDPVIVKSNSASLGINKQQSQQASDIAKSDASSLKSEDTTENHSASSRHSKSDETTKSASSQDKISIKGNEKVTDAEHSEKSHSIEVVNREDAGDKTQTALPSSQQPKQASDETSEIVAEEWVLLIDNLKKLAANEESILSTLQELDGTSVDLSLLNQSEQEVLEQITQRSFADNSRISLDGYVAAPVDDIKDSNASTVSSKKRVEQTLSSNEGQDSGVQNSENSDISLTNLQSAQNVSDLVDKVLSEVLANSDAKELSQIEIKQKAAELLLEKPEVLQQLNSKLQEMTQNSDVVDTPTVDVAISETDDQIKRVKQPLENTPPVDVSVAEDKKLLKALLTESDTQNTREPVKVDKVVEPDVAKNLVQPAHTELDLKADISQADSVELVEQEVLINQASSNKQPNLNTANTVQESDIKSILNLSDAKLEKVLENIAQRIFESNNTSESGQSEKIASQLIAPKVAEIISANDTSTKDFIAALKAGLEEFKSQLSQGRDPGIDLKALISDALPKNTDVATTTVVKTTVNLEQIASSVSQVLDLAQSMNRSIEERHDQIYSATLRDVAQVQGEQSKQLQLNQLESKFDKAVNITKPEGHQQLAEKVRWMVNTKNLVAEIRLDPAELGSVNVKVAMSGESATVNFVVQSQLARDAVDNATPRLREMLAEKGIELGQSSVRQENDAQQNQGEGEFTQQGGAGNDEADSLEVPDQVLAQQNIVNGALGGIDYFV
ncbi:MAG: flagellar hook-length control protein FliK [Paraglaciecola sp.]|uniref:flagellar hook-length control protein FliK n=1 Tax=Paraglaciecola sp. TaxID=1920173 RepID=UPI0032971237